MLVILLIVLLALPSLAAEPSAREKKLSNDIRYVIAQNKGKMRVGVAIYHLGTGERVAVEGDTPFPLASVFKLPIMVELARQLQAGKSGLSLDQQLTIRETDRCIGSGRLQNSPPGTKVTLRKAVDLMETISDNTATDMVFNKIGTQSVNQMMAGLGLKNSDIYLTNRAAYLISLGMGSQWEGMGARAIATRWLKMSRAERQKAVDRILQENQGLTLDEFQAAEDASAARQSGQAYLDDVAVAAAVDNLASPNDMATLIGQLYAGKILDAKWTAYCLDVLERQQFNTRIPRLLPQGTPVYHKTGTIVGVVNDAGVIEMPDGSGLVVVVFTRDVRQGASNQAGSVIAKISKLAYDAYR